MLRIISLLYSSDSNNVGITAAVASADIVNLSASEMLALTTDLRGVCHRNTDIYYGSPRTPEILVELRRF